MTIWFTYIIYSVSTGKLYTGITKDPQKRLEKHNAGTGAKATRVGRPWILVHIEPKPTRSDALKREAAIKKMKRKDKVLLVGLAA